VAARAIQIEGVGFTGRNTRIPGASSLFCIDFRPIGYDSFTQAREQSGEKKEIRLANPEKAREKRTVVLTPVPVEKLLFAKTAEI
jgi:hypothetical protein